MSYKAFYALLRACAAMSLQDLILARPGLCSTMPVVDAHPAVLDAKESAQLHSKQGKALVRSTLALRMIQPTVIILDACHLEGQVVAHLMVKLVGVGCAGPMCSSALLRRLSNAPIHHVSVLLLQVLLQLEPASHAVSIINFAGADVPVHAFETQPGEEVMFLIVAPHLCNLGHQWGANPREVMGRRIVAAELLVASLAGTSVTQQVRGVTVAAPCGSMLAAGPWSRWLIDAFPVASVQDVENMHGYLGLVGEPNDEQWQTRLASMLPEDAARLEAFAASSGSRRSAMHSLQSSLRGVRARCLVRTTASLKPVRGGPCLFHGFQSHPLAHACSPFAGTTDASVNFSHLMHAHHLRFLLAACSQPTRWWQIPGRAVEW